MGWTFFWAFADKLFGLGYATEAGKGWIDGWCAHIRVPELRIERALGRDLQGPGGL